MSSHKKPPPPDPQFVMCGQSPLSSLIFGPSETYKEQPVIVSGHQDGRIHEWSVVTQRSTSSWQAHTESVIWLAWAGADILLSQGREGMIKVWGRNSSSVWTNVGGILCAKFSFCESAVVQSEHNFMVAVPSEETAHIDIHVLEQSKLTLLPSSRSETESSSLLSTLSHSIKPASAKTYGMCMRMRLFRVKENKLRLMVGYESGSLTLWDVLEGHLLSEVKSHGDSVMGLDCWVSDDLSMIRCVTGSADEILKSWQIEDDKLMESASVKVTNPGFGAVAIRGDGRICASGGWDNSCRVFSLRKLNPLAVLTYHRGSVHCVTFAPDNTLATGSNDGYIALWDIYKNK